MDGITSAKITSWDNTNTNFNDWFYKDSSGYIHSKYTFIGDSEISAFGAGSSSSSGNVTVYDGLDSTSTDIALSANQGRILKNLIDNIDVGDIDLSGYYSKTEIDNKLSGKSDTTHTHTNYLTKGSWLNQSDVNFDNLTSSAFYAYASGNGTGNINNPNNYGLMAVFGSNDGYAAQLSISSENAVKVRTKYHRTVDGVSKLEWNNWTTLATKTSLDNHTHSFSLGSSKNTNLTLTVDGAEKTLTNLYSTFTKMFSYTAVSDTNEVDLNTHINGGVIRNYTNQSKWTNIPTDMKWGEVLNLAVYADDGLSGQLAWDINNQSTTDTTRKLYWRARDYSNGFTYSKWHTIAFTDSDITGTAAKATADASGNTITSTYATKTELSTHTSNTTNHITSTERTNWNKAYNNTHTHSNKTVLDGITSTKVSNWDTVYSNWNKVFTIDSNGDLKVKVNVIGEKEISAYGAGTSTSGGGSITIVDALTSTATDAALSANQGRVLKSMIDNLDLSNVNVDLSNYYTKTQTDNLLSGKSDTSHTHLYAASDKAGGVATGAARVADKYGYSGWADANDALKDKSGIYFVHTSSASNYGGHPSGMGIRLQRWDDNGSYTVGQQTFDIYSPYTQGGNVWIRQGKGDGTNMVYENWYKIIHSGNYTDYALPITGGTIKSSSSQALTINTTASRLPYIAFQNNGTNGGFIGGSSDGSMFIQTGAGSDTYYSIFKVKSDGSASISTNSTYYDVITAKNIDSYVDKFYNSEVSRTANTVLAAPNGSAGSATFRKLVAADIPTLAISKISGLQTALDGKATSSHSHSNYVDLTSAQTISGKKTFSSGLVISNDNSIADENGWGVVGVNPTGWTGLPTDGSAIGFGTGAAPVYIRTSGNDLYHYRKDKETHYTILDTSNTDAMRYTVIDASDLPTTNFYPLIFSQSSKTLKVRMFSVGGNGSLSYNRNTLEFTFRGQGWTDNPKGLTVDFYKCYTASETTIGCIGMGTDGGAKVVWVRGGLTYNVYSNIVPSLKTELYANGNEKYSVGTSFSGGTNTKVTIYWTPQTTSAMDNMYNSGGLTLGGNLSVTGTSTFTGLATFNGNLTAPASTVDNSVSGSYQFRNSYGASLSSAGWYRFATSSAANNAGGTYIFFIRRSYYNTNNEAYIISCTVDYGKVHWCILNGHANTRLITQVRCTFTNNGTMYFDLYYSGTVQNDVYVNAIGNCTLQKPTATTSTLDVTSNLTLSDGIKLGTTSAYPITIFRNATNGGAYIMYGANGQLTKSWAAGSDTSHNFAWYYKDTSAGTDICKMKLTSDGVLSSDYWMLNNKVTNPYLKLTHTYNNTTYTHYLQGYQGYLYLGAGSSKSLRIDGSGNCLAVGEVTAHSDKRLKSNIKPLSVRGELNPVTYTKDGKESIGFIADEVKEVYPELVVTDDSTDEKYLSLNYAQLTAVLYAEIKELKKEINELKNKIQ